MTAIPSQSRSTPNFAFVLYLAAVIAGALAHSVAAAQVIPCAIRWDAWYDPTSSSLTAQERLAPELWQNRAPKHCIATAQGSIRCVGTQDIIDEEIRRAVEVGAVGCWAFGRYTRNSSLTVAWKLFQSSAIKNKINWAWITELSHFGAEADRSRASAGLIGEMRQANYQKVNVIQANRPVLFVLWSELEFKALFYGDYDKFKAMLSDLATQAASVGLGRPYVVILRGIPEKAAEIAKNVGADAIGTYSIPLIPNKSGSFESLSQQTRSFWSKLAATKVPIVPTIMTGFDQRPTYARPPEPRSGTAQEPEVVYSIATDDQLSAEVQDATKFINSSLAVPSKLLLVYSWNENSEGGGSLNETLGDPTGNRLRAFRRGLSGKHAKMR